jgi:predicted transcriptional regulator
MKILKVVEMNGRNSEMKLNQLEEVNVITLTYLPRVFEEQNLARANQLQAAQLKHQMNDL